MAANMNSMKSVLRAHTKVINGCVALPPSLDEATILLEQAHAILELAVNADEADELSRTIVKNGYRAASSMMEIGIRNLLEGHSQMLGQIARH